MKQNVGFSAVIIAIIALAIRSGGPVGQPGLDSASGLGRVAPGATPPAEEPMLDGPWLATRSFFHAADKPEPPVDFETPASVQRCVGERSGACAGLLAKYFGISVPNHIQFLIATVPDPLHTRLALFADSSIQAIEKAAGNSGWIFATQWLPWIDGPNPEEKDPDKRREQRQTLRRQEKQPGILVFRRGAPAVGAENTGYSDEALLIFLVGETPTAGVNSAQFQLARAYMRAIHEPAEEVRIQGPTFSGSFYSLAELLKDDRKHARGGAFGAAAGGGSGGAAGGGSGGAAGGGSGGAAGGGPAKKYRVRGGTATSAADGAALQGSGVDFRGATANTVDGDRYFRSALEDLGIEPDRAAALIEDESAYGAAEAARAAAVGSRIRVFRFPRDISHLRNAYREAVAASKSGSSPAPDVEFSIKDPETGEDSIPVFSGSQSPLSQNGVVNSIANAIRREGILLVRVDATNVLDMLFLASALKRQCPDTRLLVTFPDVLLVQAAQNDPLNGTLVMATYPVFFESNAWMGGPQPNEPFIFPDANSESVYNATVLLLNNDSDPLQILADYHWGELNHPPTWLLTLDHQGFLPVNAYPHKKEEEGSDSWFQKVPSVEERMPRFPANRTWPVLPAPPRSWNVVATVLALGSLGLFGWVWWISCHAAGNWDARFSLIQIDTERNGRRFYLFALLLVLVLMEVTMWIPSLRSEESGGLMWLLAWIGLTAPLVALIAAWRVLGGGKAKISALVGLGLAIACLLLWLYSCLYGDDRSLFFAFRALELRFGSSPTWPVLTALGAVALFAYVQLTRFYIAVCQEPEVAMDGLPPTLKNLVHDAWADFKAGLDSSFGPQVARKMQFSREPWLLALVALVGVGAALEILFRFDLRMRSIDGRTYNVLALGLQLLVAGLLLLVCVHIRLLWRSLRAFLESLGMLPMARFFRAIDGSGAGRPIWVRRLHLESIDIHVQSHYLLHNMRILVPHLSAPNPEQVKYFAVVKGMTDEYGSQTGALLKADGERSRKDTLQLTKGVRSTNELIAKETLDFLRGYWGAKLLDGPVSSAGATAAGESADKQPAEAGPMDQFAELAQRLVALHYTAFLLYGVRQIQNLLVFLSSGFVLLMISLSCYNLQGPQFVQRVLLVLFLILGAITLSCLVGMEKDPVLSHISGSPAGKLDTGSYLKIASFGALPLFSLLASMFPSISNFLLSWVEPTLEAFK